MQVCRVSDKYPTKMKGCTLTEIKQAGKDEEGLATAVRVVENPLLCKCLI